MTGRQPSNYDSRQGSSSRPANGYGQGQGQGHGSTRQVQGSSSSKKNHHGYSLGRYLEDPQRHETWDWEKKAKDRNAKKTRL